MAIPTTYVELERRLRESGATDEHIAGAAAAYSAGYYAALHQIGQTTTDAGMAAEWHDYYPVAKADAVECLKTFKRLWKRS